MSSKRRRARWLPGLFVLAMGVALPAAPQPGFGELRLTVTNVRHERGAVYAGLFRPGSAFPKSEGRWRYTRAEVSGPRVLLVFTNVPPGVYAVGFFHDLNGNREHERGLFGIPQEPFGFYQHAKPRFKEPSFDECSFTLAPGMTEVQTMMQEWGAPSKVRASP